MTMMGEMAMKVAMRTSARPTFRCSICHKEVSQKQARIFGTCEDWKCRCQSNQRLQEKAHAIEAEFARKRQEFWKHLAGKRDTFAENTNVASPDQYLPICVPAWNRECIPVEAERKRQLREHLVEIASNLTSETTSDSEELDSRDSEFSKNHEAKLLSAACATCGGFCCQDGGNTGYLNRDTLQRVQSERGLHHANAVVDDYLDRVPDRSYEDSCIYHGEIGCGLPKEMRSDVCNRFECHGLNAIRERLEDDPDTPLFIAATENETLKRYQFADPGDESNATLINQIVAVPPNSQTD